MTESGSTASQRAMESSPGPMVVDMKASGSRENLSVKASKPTRMVSPKEENGKAVFSLYSATLKKEKTGM